MKELSPLYFKEYEFYTEDDIAEINKNGILFHDGKSVNFQICAEVFNQLYPESNSNCVGERDITKLCFEFYAYPKVVRVRFYIKRGFFKFFAKRNARQRFHNLQKQLCEYGYRTYDMA